MKHSASSIRGNRISSDVDFYLRLARRYPIVSIDEPLFFYRWHGGNLSANGVQGRVDMIEILRHTRPSSRHGIDAQVIEEARARYRVSLYQVSEYVLSIGQSRQALKGFAFSVYYDPFIGRRLDHLEARPLAVRVAMPYRGLVASLWRGTANRLRRLRKRAASLPRS